jgi:methylenetetrahydrofolate reductase (NADPH)
MKRVRDLGLEKRCFILAGVGPIKSLRALEHMRNEVPGMYIPDAVVQRLRGVPQDRVATEGAKLCSEIISEVKEIPGVAGIHVMAFNWEDAIPEILERAGLARSASRTGTG